MRTPRLIGAAASAALCFLLTSVTPASAEAPLASGLRELAAAHDRGDARLPALLALHITDRAGDPLVTVRVQPNADANAVLKQLEAVGFHLQTRSSINPWLLEGFLPLAAAHTAARISGIHSIHATQRPAQRVGLVTSQAVALEKADIAQSRGVDGTGIRVGVLSDSYDACTFCTVHAADDIKSGDLPADGVTVIQEVQNELLITDEGRAMLQLVHDIAPGSELGFASAANGELQFAENILALRSRFNADVICDDVIYLDEPMYSDGILAQAVDLVSQAGAAYFSSAGNEGLEAFEDTYRPIPFALAQRVAAQAHSNVHLEQIPAAIRPQSVHNFNASGTPSITQRFTPTALETLSFQWDEPFNLGKVRTEYIVYIFDENGNWLDPNTAPTVFYTTDNTLVTDRPIQFLALEPHPKDFVGGANVSDYQFVIGNVNGGPAQHIKYINFNGLGVSQRQNAPSTWGHAAARGGLGVAATYYAIPNFVEDFSSPGPVTIFFDTQGNRLDPPDVRFTPQLTAADGVDTTFFGIDRDGNGFPNFFGTSAASPDAAAVGALALQAAGGPGSLSPAQLYQRLEHTATPIWTPDIRWIAGAVAGPLSLSINYDWVRFNRGWTAQLTDIGQHSVASIVLDTAPLGLIFNPNPIRFVVGATTGPGIDDITHTVSADQTKFIMTFAPGTFLSGESFSFGLSVFNPLELTTQEDPDRFRGMNVTITLDDGSSFTAPVLALPKLAVNNFAGFGLVNADAATSH
jgi:hypothetical protein